MTYRITLVAMESGMGPAIASGVAVVISAALAVLSTWRSSRDKRERDADRGRIEEETTDIILARVQRELTRVYGVLDKRDRRIAQFMRWVHVNRDGFSDCGIDVPEFVFDWDGEEIVKLGEPMLTVDPAEPDAPRRSRHRR